MGMGMRVGMVEGTDIMRWRRCRVYILGRGWTRELMRMLCSSVRAA